ncbi:unnamed protein product (macronuclear) [Paramecium tetraurelia]|uniref:Deacetylase sirtuin-type domain-containing protein n=1 Tax=Paramecium tetraurelia TaxID=5888 RepID=A0BIG1_PARTE|nr:uncharacterized protein GSPATT00004700001 [Paramecium tetraurelia]CAK58328.1 unnamed protein product [Paramecium tetraurelia]|eukprot:XP_001425726.1 hypothetical protein (macronuclear) [Paramecium tetraurelia strain d4-2]
MDQNVQEQEEELDEKQLQEKMRYEKIQKEIQESQDRSTETLQKMKLTFQTIDDVQEQARSTVDNIDNFQKTFSVTMDKLLENIGKSLISNSIKSSEHNPKTAIELTINEAKQLITKNTVILCGAGLSKASGIPTSKEQNGEWIKGECNYPLSKLKTRDFLVDNPKVYWEWHKQYKQLVQDKIPNAGHLAIKNFKEKNKDALIVNLSIDNLLASVFESEEIKYGYNKQIYEINGNIKYMRCLYECTFQEAELMTVYDIPDLELNEIPKCPICGSKGRPHLLLLDDEILDENCRITEIQELSQKYETIIVIGTTLQTHFAKTMVCEFIKKKATIIEINPEPVIEVGNTFWLIGKSEEILPELLD